MGTPVSKSSENSVNETETEFVPTKPAKRTKSEKTEQVLEETSKRLSDIKAKVG